MHLEAARINPIFQIGKKAFSGTLSELLAMQESHIA